MFELIEVNSRSYSPISSIEEETELALINRGSGVVEVYVSTTPPSDTDRGYPIEPEDRAYMLIRRGETLYVRYSAEATGPSLLLVSDRVAEHPGIPRLRIQQQGVIANTFQLKFYRNRVEQTLAQDILIEDREIEFTAGHTIVVGDYLEFTDPQGGFMIVQAIAVNVNTVTIDIPSVKNFPAATTTVTSRSSNLLVDGSATPIIFSVTPDPTQAGELHRITISLTGTTAMDFTKFGSRTPLSNGIIIRKRLPDGSFLNLFKAKTNGDLIEVCNQHSFLSKSGGGEHAFIGKYEPPGHNSVGIVIPIEGNLAEEIEIVIQDNLAAGDITSFNIIGEGILY